MLVQHSDLADVVSAVCFGRCCFSILIQQMLNWIGGVLGISGDAKSVTGSTPFFSELKSEISATRNRQQVKNGNKNWQQKTGSDKQHSNSNKHNRMIY